MQFIIHLPTLNINLPGNGYIVMKNIAMVATFSIPYVSLETIKTYKLTEVEILTDYPSNVKDQMELLGYNSAYISVTLGPAYVVLFFTLLGLLLIILTLPF
jgi:hypothetical protein